MTDEDQRVRAVVDSLAESLSCDRDGTRLRYGDYECPRCGADVEDVLSEWARRLVRRLEGPGGERGVGQWEYGPRARDILPGRRGLCRAG